MLSQKSKSLSLLAASIVLALAGIGAFLWIFGRDFNIYWLILSPVIIVLYELPAVYVFVRYRKRLARTARPEDRPSDEADRDPGRP